MDRDDRWIVRNFGRLVRRYPGKYVAVVDERVVASGPDPGRVETVARLKTGAKTPSVLLVPRRRDLVHVL